MAEAKPASRNSWAWIPTLYLAEGLPYVVVMTVSVIMFKNLGVSNTDIAFYTSWLYLPWVIKPLWSPVVDILKTRRLWIWAMQLLVGAGLAGVALTIPVPNFFRWTLASFWLLAFSSATHDIAADGFYMLALTEKEQSFFVGVRNTFYRVAMICGQGGLVIVAGVIERRTGNVALAWSAAFGVIAGLFVCFGVYHWFILPRPASDLAGSSLGGWGGATDEPSGSSFSRWGEATDEPSNSPETEPNDGSPDQSGSPHHLNTYEFASRRANTVEHFTKEFFAAFSAFFRKPKIVVLLLFLLLYRFGEAQLVKMVAPFLLDAREIGGLGLTTEQVGLVYGTVGVIALMLGGLLGGFVVSRQGLKFWLWPMVLAIHLPDAMFIYLAYAQPGDLNVIGLCVAIEQFGYGFGFTAYMLYMIYIARGQHQTAHYAICTGFMALGMMIPGMWSGWLQEHIGYQHFFVWVILATVPSFFVAVKLPLDAEFGKKA